MGFLVRLRTDTLPTVKRACVAVAVACLGLLLFYGTGYAFTVVGSVAVLGQLTPVASPDGSVWLTTDYLNQNGDDTHALYHVTTAGQVTSTPVSGPDESWDLEGMAVGPDGNIWIAASDWPREFHAALLRVTPGGNLKSFRLRGRPKKYIEVASGPDGNIWFTGMGNSIGKMTPSGHVQYFRVRQSDAIEGIVQGPDGAMWSARIDPDGQFDPVLVKALRISTTGRTREYTTRPASGITLGSDGNFWLAGLRAIQRLTPRGRLKRFPIAYPIAPAGDFTGNTNRNPFFVASAAEGLLAFTAGHEDPHGLSPSYPSIGTMTTAGKATETFIEQPRASGIESLPLPSSLITAADGRIWAIIHNFGIKILSLDDSIFRRPGHPTIRRLKTSRGAVTADIRCSGSPGTFCAGKISLSINGGRPGRQRSYAIAPLNRLAAKVRIPNRKGKSKATVTVTSSDPVTKAVTTVSRSISLR